ncbi:polyphosphate polymerase domain-containing protein [Actinoplanes sp. NPDC051475]|uniref:polyphosphate polymerase domain-containing protein n=1 Tax=Actinoplanes sp. NPDC051475 TaxID=3157225 RepID=UPI00344EAE5A
MSTDWVSGRLAAAAPIGLAELDAAAGLQQRVDTKYLITLEQLDQVADALTAGHRRLSIDGVSAFAYRSSYLDTAEHACFHAHRQGRRLRFKARTRCYDDTGLCRFEIKLKDGRGGTDKHARTVPATQFATVPDLAPALLTEVLATRYGIPAPTDLESQLLVSHHRHTLAARLGACRVTLDTGLRFTAGPVTAGLRDDLVLVETKSARGRSDADSLLRRVGARPVNVSKYCAGMALTHPHLPDQPWRPLLRRHFTGPHPADIGARTGHHRPPSHAAACS